MPDLMAALTDVCFSVLLIRLDGDGLAFQSSNSKLNDF